MPRHFRISDVLLSRHRRAFREILLNPKSTIDGAHAWLRKRGYDVHRSAVGSYRRHVRGRMALESGAMADPVSDKALRRQIAHSLERLEGRDLAGLATITAFLVKTTIGGK